MIAHLEPAVGQTPYIGSFAGVFSARAMLAGAYAYLGRSADAVRESDRYLAAARGERHSDALPTALVNAAHIDVLVGRRDTAVARLEETFRLPAGESVSPALLRTDATWPPLRGHPTFERLAAGRPAAGGG